jgi:PTS system galactitol-specific IIA component
MRGEKNLKVSINAEAVKCNLDVSTQDELVRSLSDSLVRTGFVKADYPDHVLSREEKYPTGLPFDGFGIAIPHTNPEYVHKPTIAVATLAKPLVFRVMGSPNETVDVSLVFMLALDDGHTHLEFLQKVIKLAQEREKVQQLFSAPNDEELFHLVSAYLSEGAL